MQALRAVYRMAAADDPWLANPAAGVPAPRRVLTPKVVPTRGQVREMLAGAPDPRTKALVAILAYTGMRIGEALSLRWSDWPDTSEGRLQIRATKTRRPRAVPVPAKLARHLRAWRRAQAAQQLAAPRWADEGWILASDVGTHWEVHNARARFNGLANGHPKRGLPPICPGATPHSLRRSYGSSSGSSAVSEEAAEVAGDVAGEAAFDLSAGLSLCGATGDVVAGGWLVLDPDPDHGMQRSVELTIAVAVQSIPGGDLATVRRGGCHAGEHRERCLGVDAAGVGPGAQHRRGHDRTDAEHLEQVRAPTADDGHDRLLELPCLFQHRVRATGQGPQRHYGAGRLGVLDPHPADVDQSETHLNPTHGAGELRQPLWGVSDHSG